MYLPKLIGFLDVLGKAVERRVRQVYETEKVSAEVSLPFQYLSSLFFSLQ